MSIIVRIINTFKMIYRRVYRHYDPEGYAKYIGVKMGENCRLISVDFGTEPYLVSLGNHVSATATTFITHDGSVWLFRDEYPEADLFGPIKVGNNVFFGYGVVVLPGVTIGDNVIIGAGAVVTKDIPSNSVVAGVPAKKLKTIQEFKSSVIDKMDNTKLMNNKEKRIYLEKNYL